MDLAIFYSDSAIIVYELVVIAVMAFFIKKLLKEKKEIMNLKSRQEQDIKEEILNKQLSNEKRRDRA